MQTQWCMWHCEAPLPFQQLLPFQQSAVFISEIHHPHFKTQ